MCIILFLIMLRGVSATLMCIIMFLAINNAHALIIIIIIINFNDSRGNSRNSIIAKHYKKEKVMAVNENVIFSRKLQKF